MNLLSKDNNGYKYILVLVNAFNKKIFAQALRTKKAGEVLIATKKLLTQAKFKFANVMSDKGKFY